MQITKKVLPNNLRVVFIPKKESESVTAVVFCGTGSRYEKDSQAGISHFLEHMFFKGTQKRPTPKALALLIDGIGGEFNAFTTEELTGYHIKSSKDHLGLVLDVLSDILKNSLFDQKEIEREKGVILEEMRMNEDDPRSKIFDYYKNLIFAGSSLGRDVIGKEEVIKGVKREDFLAYMKTFYYPSNMVLAVSGNVSESKLFDIVNRYFGSISDGKTPNFEKAKINQEKPKIKVHFKKSEQAHFCLGFPSFSLTHPDRYNTRLLNVILGSGMSSRLFIKVREELGLAYYVRSYNDPYLDLGTILISAGVNIGRIDEALKVILAELESLKGKGVSEEELKKAKEYIKGRYRLGLEDTRNIAFDWGEQEILEKKLMTPEEFIRKIESVKREDVQRVAKEVFDFKKLNFAVIGPYKDEGKFLKIFQ